MRNQRHTFFLEMKSSVWQKKFRNAFFLKKSSKTVLLYKG